MASAAHQDHPDVAQAVGPSGRVAAYRVPDTEMATGSTLSGYTAVTTLKGTGAIEKVYSVELGETLFGPLVVHHWDLHMQPQPGTFTLHPAHQEHAFVLANGVHVQEDLFVLNGGPHAGGEVDPPAIYYVVALHNATEAPVEFATYAFCDLRGRTALDVAVRYDDTLRAFVAWNAGQPAQARVFGCSTPPTSFESRCDHSKAVAPH